MVLPLLPCCLLLSPLALLLERSTARACCEYTPEGACQEELGIAEKEREEEEENKGGPSVWVVPMSHTLMSPDEHAVASSETW